MNRRTILITIGLSLLLIAPLAASAQCTTVSSNGASFTPLVQPQGRLLQNIYCNSNGSLSNFLNALFETAIALGAMAAVLQIVRAGYEYMGSDMWHKKEEAKTILGDTVIGLLLLLSAYLILSQINPCILQLNILSDFSSSGFSSCTVAQYNAPGSISAH